MNLINIIIIIKCMVDFMAPNFVYNKSRLFYLNNTNNYNFFWKCVFWVGAFECADDYDILFYFINLIDLFFSGLIKCWLIMGIKETSALGSDIDDGSNDFGLIKLMLQWNF